MRASPVIDDYSDILEPQDHPAATRIITDLVALYGVPGVPEGLRRSLAVGLKGANRTIDSRCLSS